MTKEAALEEMKVELDTFLDGTGVKGREKEEAANNKEFKLVYEANIMAINALDTLIKLEKVLLVFDADTGIDSDKAEKPRISTWIRMSDLSEDEDDRYKCSYCGNVVHHSSRVNLYTFNQWCGRCGSYNGGHTDILTTEDEI